MSSSWFIGEEHPVYGKVGAMVCGNFLQSKKQSL